MKFYRGKKEKYNLELHSNGIYFAHDDNNINTILANGHEFGTNYTEVKWLELKDLRDNSQLIPGSLYRITDYNCTTTQENTRSAGHQFDIVLLALSENKLAEEGWAMMHDNLPDENTIYAVTFSDQSESIDCYVYDAGNHINLVIVESGLGQTMDYVDITLDVSNKTATCNMFLGDIDLTDVPKAYNYFQNSNLSAWKVWYCLDNDTARFAWADDSVDEGSPASITINGTKYNRNPQEDDLAGIHPYAWSSEDALFSSLVFTNVEEPSGYPSNAYNTSIGGKGTKSYAIDFYTRGQEGTGLPNGRGVIYRLIDEWGNDVGYDFKNIQFNAERAWLYAIADEDDTEEDPTLDGIRVKAIHLLSNYNNSLSNISFSRLGGGLVNVIFLNNNGVYTDGSSNTLVRDGQAVFK